MLLNDLVDEYGEQNVYNAFRILIEAVTGDNEPSAWAQQYINDAIENDITDGTSPKMFATREQVATMIIRAKFGKCPEKSTHQNGV